MESKALKICIGLAIAVCVTKFSCCTRIKTPAPDGIHGEYTLTPVPVYITNDIAKDSILKKLEKENLVIKTGKTNEYDSPWDSLRYLVSDIECGNEKIEACIEFNEKRKANTTFRVLWINAKPTEDNLEYKRLAKKYYECFDAMLRKNKLIK